MAFLAIKRSNKLFSIFFAILFIVLSFGVIKQSVPIAKAAIGASCSFDAQCGGCERCSGLIGGTCYATPGSISGVSCLDASLASKPMGWDLCVGEVATTYYDACVGVINHTCVRTFKASTGCLPNLCCLTGTPPNSQAECKASCVSCAAAAPTVTVTPDTYSGPAGAQTFNVKIKRNDTGCPIDKTISGAISCTGGTPTPSTFTTVALDPGEEDAGTNISINITANGNCKFTAQSPDNAAIDYQGSKTVNFTVVPAGGTWIRYSIGFYIAHDCSTNDYFNKTELDGQACPGGTWQNCLNNSPSTGAYDCFIGFGVDCITTTKRCSDKFYAGDCDCVPAAGAEICNNGIDDPDPDALIDCADIVDCPNGTLCSGGGTCSGGACVPAGPPNVHIDTCASCNPVGTGPCQNMLNNNLWTAISAPTTLAMCSADTNVSSICATEIAGGFNGCQVGLSNGFTCPCASGGPGCVPATCAGGCPDGMPCATGKTCQSGVCKPAAAVCDNDKKCEVGAGETAANCPNDCKACGGPGMYVSPLGPGYCTIEEILGNATSWILALVSSIIILVIIIGGLMYISSAGDEEKLRASKNMIFYAIVGLAIILVSYALITEVTNLLKGA